MRDDTSRQFNGLDSFQVATSGGQPGNQNAAKGRRWHDAINRALEKKSKAEGIQELDRLAEEFLRHVEAEGITGFRELGDRLDGKPSQGITDGDGNPLTLVFQIKDERVL